MIRLWIVLTLFLALFSRAFSQDDSSAIATLSDTIDKLIWSSSARANSSFNIERKMLFNGYSEILLTSKNGRQLLFEGFADTENTFPNGQRAFAVNNDGHLVEVPPDLSLVQKRKDILKVSFYNFKNGIVQQLKEFELPFISPSLTINYDLNTTRITEYIGVNHYIVGPSGYPEKIINIDGSKIESPNLPFAGLIFESSALSNVVASGTLLPNFTYIMSGEMSFNVSISNKKITSIEAFYTASREAYATPIHNIDSLRDWLVKAWGLNEDDFINMILQESAKKSK